MPCGIPAGRRSRFASRLIPKSSPDDKYLETWGGRSANRKLLNGGKLSAHYLASMGKIQGTLRISRLIEHRKYKSVITSQAHLALRRVPLNCLRISWLNLGSARSWRRFANFSCPFRIHHASFVLNHLDCAHLRRNTPFADYCAPTVHQKIFPRASYEGVLPVTDPGRTVGTSKPYHLLAVSLFNSP